MKSKDQILLEEAYSQIIEEVGTPAYDSILKNLGDVSRERINKARETGDDVLKIVAQLEKESGSAKGNLARVLQHKKIISDDEYRKYINSSNTTSDMSYAKKGEYVESFVHGIQPISEAKKKVNPWAVCNASTGGKKKNPKKFEKCVKGVKKNTIEENENIAPSSVPSFKDQMYAKKGSYVNQPETQEEEDLASWIKTRLDKKLPQDSEILPDLSKLLNKLNAHKLGKEITNA